MAFLTEELINFAAKAQLGILGTGDRNTAPYNLTWYEEITTNDWQIKPGQVLLDLPTIPPAKDLVTARANAVSYPTIILDKSQNVDAIHLTPSPNSRVFFCTSVYGDLSSRMFNLLMPQMIPRLDPPYVGYPSIGYMPVFWQGDPNAGGTKILTTVEQVGAVVGWEVIFGSGAIKVAASFAAVTNPADVWVTGFFYIGRTLTGWKPSITLYLTVADAELATGSDNDLMYCVETETFYRYESTAGGYARDGLYVLDTDDEGTTRWLAAAGQYMLNPVKIDKSVDFKEQSAVPSPIAGYVRAFVAKSQGNDIYTRLLAHFNEGNGSLVHIDSSQYVETITGYNSIAQSDTVRKFGISVLYMDGVNQYLSIAQLNFDFGTDDFAIDTWVYLSSSREHRIYTHGANANNFFKFYVNSLQELGLRIIIAGVQLVNIRGGNVSNSEWHHVAMQRDGNNWYLYVDGTRVVSANVAATLNFAPDPQIGTDLSCPSQADVYYGLYGYWKLDENAGVLINDSSGNGRNGTLNVGAWVPGKLGSALQFTGIATNYINMGAIASFENNVPWSFSCWFKTVTGAQIAYMSKMLNGGALTGYRIFMAAAGNVHVEIRNALANRIYVETVASGYDDNLWHHLTVTYDGSLLAHGIRIYVDGVNLPYTINNDTLTLTILNAAVFNLAGVNNSAVQNWIGTLDDCALWGNKVLTQAEVTYLYNAGVGIYIDALITSYTHGYFDEYRISRGVVRFNSAVFGLSDIPYGMTAPFWILPDGSVVGLKDLGYIGTKQWGEDGINLFREDGRVAVYKQLGSGSESIRVKNNTGVLLSQYKVVRLAPGYDLTNTIPHIEAIGGSDQIPIGLLIIDIPDTVVDFILKRGVISVSGFDTTGAVALDPVYTDTNGNLTLVDSGMRVGTVLTINVNGTIYFDVGGGGSGGKTIEIEDEGIAVNLKTKRLNFVGADVSAYQNPGDPDKVDVYIPALAFQPFYNSSNPQGNAVVADLGVSRSISSPTAEGVPFKIGDWIAGTQHPATNNGSLAYVHTAPCSFIDLLSTIEVNVYDADGVSLLAQHITAAISGDIDVTVSNIRIQVIGWAVDSIRYKANIAVTINIAAIIAAGGRCTVTIIHHNGGSNFTKSETLFYDPNTNPASLAGGVTTIAETGGGVVTRFISGVEYYYLGSQFSVDVTDIDYINDASYPATVLEVNGAEYGLPTLNLGVGSLIGWTVFWDDIDDSYQNTVWAINAANFFAMTTTGNVSARVWDWVAGGLQNSPDSAILVETHNTANTDTVERFYYENYRCSLLGNFDLVNQKGWVSNVDVGPGDACFFNGGCERNVQNFQIYNPNPGSQPDYSASQNPTVELIREIITDGVAHANARINISGTYATLEVKMAKAWDGTANGGSVWMNCLSNYNAGQFNFGNPLAGTGCRTGSGAGYVDITFGSQNTINTGNTIYLRIGFTAGQRVVGPLSVVFS